MFCYGSISSFRNFLCKDKSQSYSSHAKWMNAQHYNSPFPPSQFPLCSFPRHNVYRCVWLAYPAKRQGRYTAADASPYIRKPRPAQEACIPLYFQHLSWRLENSNHDTACVYAEGCFLPVSIVAAGRRYYPQYQASNRIRNMGAKYIDETFKSLKRYCQGV